MLQTKNTFYASLTLEERLKALYSEYKPEEILVTSSFGASSAYLLGIISKVNPAQQIHFIDTTFSFPETLYYKKKLSTKLGLKVVDIKPEKWENDFTQKNETWIKDPNLCCSVNKVKPLEKLKSGFKIWISGLMSHQNESRAKKNFFEPQGDLMKFYPLIDKTNREMQGFISENELPIHPLQLCGYNSIGCFHCTKKGEGREGRWVGSSKTECGLHLS